MAIDAKALRTGLVDERRELQAAITRTEHDLMAEDDDMTRAGLELQRSQLRRVERALQRHADGTWRDCEQCDEPLTEAQIRVLPTATHCAACAEDEVFWGDTSTIRRDELGLSG